MTERISLPTLSLYARSLDVPSSGANRLPFRGVLTRIDEASDSAPHGSNGKRVLITMDAARNALDSLLGMAVNFNPDGHSPREKVGVIFGSEIVGNELHINGVIYAADFPEVAEQIQANKEKLGFSFEARDLFTNDVNADPVNIVGLSFTGAAILLKNAAAYKTTSIFASENKETSKMNILEQIKAAGVKLDDVSAAAKNMSASDLRVLIKAFSDEVLAKEAGTSKESARLQRLSKAMAASATDQSAQNTLKNIRDELRRIGLPNDINAAAERGGYQLGEVDKALKQSGWHPERRMNLKNKLDHVGLLTY